MKLSDIKGERALDVIIEIADPIINIATDKKTKEVFGKSELPEGMTREEYGAMRLKSMIPFILKDHRDDAIQIVASINNVSVDDYKKNMTLASITGDCLELMSDNSFIGLFTSAQTDPNSSGSAQATTTESKE